MFTQMSTTKGLKHFKERAVAALIKEYTQLDNMNVFAPEDPDKLTKDQKQKALRAVNLIKEKGCGRIKGRACADGSTQRGYIPHEEATSPTISLQSLLTTLVINAQENRYITIFDVPGAYLNADMPEDKDVG
jgi:hypothetical protein